MIGIQLDGAIDCLDGEQIAFEVQRLGIDSANGLEYLNQFVIPSGREPSRAWVAMMASDAATLNFNDPHEVLLTDGYGATLTLGGWRIVRQLNLTAGLPGDVGRAVMLELADVRYLASNPTYQRVINKQYNCYASGWGGTKFYDSSLTGLAAPWTWAEMVEDIWNAIGVLGPWSGLPYSPSLTPKNWNLVGVNAYDALWQVLDLLHCTLSPDLVTGNLSIVSLGEPDPSVNIQRAYLTGNDLLQHATEPEQSMVARAPASVRVLFNKLSVSHGTERETAFDSTQWVTQAVHEISLPTGLAGGSGACPIYSDQMALVTAAGAITNLPDLTTIATEIRDKLVQKLSINLQREVYDGVYPFAIGKQLSVVAYGQMREGSLQTEIQLSHREAQTWPTAGGILDSQRDKLDNRSPDFARPTVPLYHSLCQLIEIDSPLPDANGYYSANLVLSDGTGLAFSTYEAIWAKDLRATPTLIIGQKFLARLFDYAVGKPVYVFDSGGPGGGSVIGLHNLLSATHPDTVPASPLTGDMVAEQATTPTRWQRFAVGLARQYIGSWPAKDLAVGAAVSRANCATTGDIPGWLAGTFTGTPAVVDGVTPDFGDVIVVWQQANQHENGIYYRNGVDTWVRVPWFDNPAEVVPGYRIVVQYGSVNSGLILEQTATVVSVDTDPIVFMNITGAGTAPLIPTYRYVTAIQEIGQDVLDIGSIAPGQYLRRIGSEVRGWPPSGPGPGVLELVTITGPSLVSWIANVTPSRIDFVGSWTLTVGQLMVGIGGGITAPVVVEQLRDPLVLHDVGGTLMPEWGRSENLRREWSWTPSTATIAGPDEPDAIFGDITRWRLVSDANIHGIHEPDDSGAAAAINTTAVAASTVDIPAWVTDHFEGAPTVLDGHNLIAGDLVLVKNQISQFQNGLYIVTDLALGVWHRWADFDTPSEMVQGYRVAVANGAQAGTHFVQTEIVKVLNADSVSWSNIGLNPKYAWARIIELTNIGTETFTLIHQSAAASYQRRIVVPSKFNHKVYPCGTVRLWYNPQDQKWYVFDNAYKQGYDLDLGYPQIQKGVIHQKGFDGAQQPIRKMEDAGGIQGIYKEEIQEGVQFQKHLLPKLIPAVQDDVLGQLSPPAGGNGSSEGLEGVIERGWVTSAQWIRIPAGAASSSGPNGVTLYVAERQDWTIASGWATVRAVRAFFADGIDAVLGRRYLGTRVADSLPSGPQGEIWIINLVCCEEPPPPPPTPLIPDSLLTGAMLGDRSIVRGNLESGATIDDRTIAYNRLESGATINDNPPPP